MALSFLTFQHFHKPSSINLQNILYHYTTIPAKSILRDAGTRGQMCFWATRYDCFADAEEFKSEDKYKAYYKKRCDIAHEGFLMTGDVDIYADIQEQDADWRMGLEILQAARMSLHHWLRRKQTEASA